MTDARNDEPETNSKRKPEAIRGGLARLHLELVKLQQWVAHKGLKV